MSLLTDDEIDAAWARSPQNNLRDYAKEIEAAVIRKLAAVSVEPVMKLADDYAELEAQSSYMEDQGTSTEMRDDYPALKSDTADARIALETAVIEALAAARVQALEEAAKICECQWSTLEERDAGIEFAEAIRALIGGLNV